VKPKLGNRRITGTEQYYTPIDLAKRLTAQTLSLIPNFQDRSFLEPAGGTGSFIEALKSLGVTDIESVDLYPKHEAVQEANFLEWIPVSKNLITISNPPFGRNNALSVPFFNHAAGFSDYIGFLVPRSWRKWSVQNRLDDRFHLIHDEALEAHYETAEEQSYQKGSGFRTCFQIWEKRTERREQFRVPDNGFIKKSLPEDADIAMRVFGYGCGKVLRDFEPKPNTTLMFLKVLSADVIHRLEGLDYERFSSNTAYTKALSFQEINFLLNEQLLGDGLAHKDQE
jgi:predicted RNA methylase